MHGRILTVAKEALVKGNVFDYSETFSIERINIPQSFIFWWLLIVGSRYHLKIEFIREVPMVEFYNFNSL